MQLSQAEPNQKYQIVELKAEAILLERLRSMGFGRCRVVELILKDPKRPMIIGFQGSSQRVALSKEVAEHVIIEPWSEETP